MLLINEFVNKEARFDINIAGKLYPARAYLYPVPLPSVVEGN